MIRRHMSAAILLAASTLLSTAATAGATVPTGVLSVTAQAQQADAAFLAYAPAPAGGAGALCLVDTGVNANPDTTPGLIASYAIDGGTTGDVDPEGHGTTMAMIAGGAGKGILGVWPALKVVSVRATNVPSPGHEPTYEFTDYWDGMQVCQQYATADHIKAVDLALASQIPPSSDQGTIFATTVANLEAQYVAVVAAAGNDPGPVEEPGAESGVLPVGADTAQPGSLSDTPVGSLCAFSANQSIGLYAPGCGLDSADPFTDAPYCCDDGTSQASAFTASVIVALMSYDQRLDYVKAEQLLTSTAHNGDIDVAAAFRADDLGDIVAEGTSAIPTPPNTTTTTTTTTTATTTTTTTSTPSPSSKPPKSPVSVRSVRWSHGVLRIRLEGMRKQDSARITLFYADGHRLIVSSRRSDITIHTGRPRRVVVRVIEGRTALSEKTVVAT